MPLNVDDFNDGELIIDEAGNKYVTRNGVARVLLTSLPTLSTTHKKNGLIPLKRRIKRWQVYMLEDVIDYFDKKL
jgi:hypothetical protein